ncbi:MAG TPA: 1-deoxy-D-xylulose-5-phosphate synthase [Fibrobacteria bacterium]|jgi:1-deoxy-D-xylulose-5-phosphate synthase|nr:1-deoxy-D-xylulose-5-phosphate synthase [Fibrobacteria bacterium]
MLENINSPADLKRLSIDQLKALATEMRDTIVRQVASKGGHLASSLGTVDLTLAIHYVYDAPKDKVVWDTGHQAYPHKLVTGRYKEFHTLKQFGGLSGFLKRDESPYDAFGAGHATTSLSAALGMAAARTKLGRDNDVIGIIGDGSMTGGMAYEALNNAGEIDEKVVFILNDNKMSISKNVGAISKYLNRILVNPKYNKLKDDVWDLAGKLPQGKHIQKLMARADRGIRRMIVPGGFFEDLGIRYFGPVDGHDIEALIEILGAVKELPGPNLIHVVTTKGQGWEKSEADAIKWHASNPFDIESGKLKAAPAATPGLTKVFGEAITELAQKDKRIVAITGAMPEGCGLNIMANALPDRVYDVGIAEEYAVTFAAGAACDGLKPVVAIYSTFLQRAFDQVVHDVAIQHLNVTFVLDRAGLVGLDGPTHHGAMDLSYLGMIPGMVILAPSDEKELRNLLHTALEYNEGPIAVRYPRGNAYAPDAKLPFETLPIGLPNVVEEGEDLLILAVGHMLAGARKAAAALRAEGFKPTVVDVRTVKPLNREAYDALFARHRAVLTIEDNVLHGGYGTTVSLLMNELGRRDIPLGHVALPDEFVTHGEVPVLHRILGMDADGIQKKALELLNSNTMADRA